MITEVVVKRWRCDQCHKGFSNKTRARKHATSCVKDPAVRACATCRYDYRGGDGLNEPADPCCDLGIRPEGEICIRNCGAWEPR